MKQGSKRFWRDTIWVLPAVAVVSAALAYWWTPWFLLYIPFTALVLTWMAFVRGQE